MKKRTNGRKIASHGFSNPWKTEPIAQLNGRPHYEGRISACGVPPNENEEERRRKELNSLSSALLQLVGSEPEYYLLRDVIDEGLSVSSVAAQTLRDKSVLSRRLLPYLEQLKAKALADPELRAIFAEFLDV